MPKDESDDNWDKATYASMSTEIGKIFLASADGRLFRLHTGGTEKDFREELEKKYGLAPVRDNAALAFAIRPVEEYFAGRLKNFNIPTEFREGTPFQKHVWSKLQTIPYGEVRSYKWLAEESGSPNGSRAVGNANGKNPLAVVVPCHRVVKSTGELGGFTGGVDKKKKLLELEGLRDLHPL